MKDWYGRKLISEVYESMVGNDWALNFVGYNYSKREPLKMGELDLRPISIKYQYKRIDIAEMALRRYQSCWYTN